MNLIPLWLQRHHFSYRELFTLVLMSALANVYFLANYAPSIDSELAAVRSSSEIWIIQGRFTTYLMETLLFPQPSLPFSPYIFLAIMTALTQMFLLRAHGIAPSWRSYVAYGLFITYPTWWLIQEFPANVPATGIGFLFVAAALLLQSEKPASSPHYFSRVEAARVLIIGLLLALSAGAYQTLLLLFACGTIGVALCRSLDGLTSFSWRQTFLHILHGGICLIIGAFFYFILNKLALVLSGTRPEYVAEFVRFDFLSKPFNLIASIAAQIWKTYSGSAVLFGAAIPAAGIALVCAAVAVTRAQPNSALPHLLLLILILVIPFLLCLMTGPNGVPLRAMVALPYVIWLCTLLSFTLQRGTLLLISIIVYAIFQLQIINLTSQYVATATLVKQQDRFMGFEIGHRMLQLRGNDSIETPIKLDVYGYGEMYRASLFAAASSGVTRGSFFGWDNGSIWRIAAYLRVLGFDTVSPVPSDKRKELTEQFEQMPVWPQEGSLRRSGDYYLLKLGTIPDDAHKASTGK